MRIEDFGEKDGCYFWGRYVEYWKSGEYFHKKVHYIRCYRSKDDSVYSVGSKGEMKYLYLNHNLRVVFQTWSLKVLLNKEHPICWNDNEY